MLNPNQQQELLDSVVEDFTSRLRLGERPAIAEYKSKYPSLSEEIDELLTSVAMIEELKSQPPPTTGSLKRDLKEITKLERIGDYRIVRELGRGGMGVVFEAVHESLGRRVAIKVMPNRTFDDDKYLERFKREAQAAANLHHTNIVSVFGIGQIDDHHYYVMEFVDGQPLSQILAELNSRAETQTAGIQDVDTKCSNTTPQFRPSSHLDEPTELGAGNSSTMTMSRRFNTERERFQWAADLGLQIADGLAYAHQLNLLHRDVKPSNILVDKNETAWLTDFGLVKNISGQSITRTGDIIGTPQYMAPEAFEGKYDQRSETYCLGLTLYELVTARPAFENASTPELIRRITTTTPDAPRKINRRVPRDLNRIIVKAMSKEPRYRYQKAADMRDDLRAFLENRAISARKVSMTENIYRWSCRNPFAATMSLITALMICAIAIGATVALRFTTKALTEVQEQKIAADVEKRIAGYNKEEAEKMLRLVVASYDELFRNIVLKDASQEQEDVSLDGFDDLAGISTAVNEDDANALEQMLEFYIEFAETNKDYAQLTELTAKSHRRVANIYHLTGNYRQAIEAYEKSIDSYQEIFKISAQEPRIVLALSKTMNEKGRVLEFENLGRGRNQAMREYRRAIEILESHPINQSSEPPFDSGSHPVKFALQLQLAKTLILLGSPIINYLPEIPDRFRELSRSFPPNRLARSRLFTSSKVGYRVSGTKESLQSIKRAQQIAAELARKSPEDKQVKLVQAIAWCRLAILQSDESEHDSNQSLVKSEQILRELVRQFPDDSAIEFALAQMLSVPRRIGKRFSKRELEQSNEILTELKRKHPRNIDYAWLLADVSWRLGMEFKRDQEFQLASENLLLANQIYQDIAPQTPRNRNIQINAFSCLLHAVDLLADSQNYDQSIELLDSAIQNLDDQNLGNSRYLKSYTNRRKAMLYATMATVEKDAKNFAAATWAWRRALDFLERDQIFAQRRNNSRRALTTSPN